MACVADREPLPALAPFEVPRPPRLIFGEGVCRRIASLVRDLGGTRVLLVTDPGIVAAGHVGTVRECLEHAGIAHEIHDRVRENPTTLDVDRCVEVARTGKVDLIIGLGGGSSMDTAKGCNFLLTGGGEMRDYQGIGKVRHPMLPFIAIPTTAGTGSECQSFALIADEGTRRKMACGDHKAAARVALLDPSLTLSQPDAVTAHTGVDALSHALESAVTRARTPVSGIWSGEAFRLIARALPRVLEEGDDPRARAEMQLGAAFSGLAIENSMLGAAHSAANPLTARFGVIHGVAVGIMLPQVMEWNAADAPTRETYAELARTAGISRPGEDPVRSLLCWTRRQLQAAAVPSSLSGLGVPEDAIPDLALEASRQWTARFNPRTPSVRDFEALYRSIASSRS